MIPTCSVCGRIGNGHFDDVLSRACVGWGSHGYVGGKRFFTCPACNLPSVEQVFNELSRRGPYPGKFNNDSYKGIHVGGLTLKLAVSSTGVPESLYLEYVEKLYVLFNDPAITTYLPLPAGHYLLRNKGYCEVYNQTYEGE